MVVWPETGILTSNLLETLHFYLLHGHKTEHEQYSTEFHLEFYRNTLTLGRQVEDWDGDVQLLVGMCGTLWHNG